MLFNELVLAIHKRWSYVLRKMFEAGEFADDGSWTLSAEHVEHYHNIIPPYERLLPESKQFITEEANIIATIYEKSILGLIRDGR